MLHTCLFFSNIYFIWTLGSGQGGLKDNIILETKVGSLHYILSLTWLLPKTQTQSSTAGS